MVEVTWLDHSGPWPYGSKPKLVKRRTAGYVVDDLPGSLTVAGTWDGRLLFDDMTVIGKPLIVKVRPL